MARNIESEFLALWRRALNLESLSDLTPELVRGWATAQKLEVDWVDERDVGVFTKTPSVVLSASGSQACFPKVSADGCSDLRARREYYSQRASLWAKLEWFEPPWLPQKRVNEMLREAGPHDGERARELFDYHTSTLYTIPFQAVCVAQLMPRSRSLSDFCPLIAEAFLGFYSGYRASSIAALIPIIEGSVRRIVSTNESLLLTAPDSVGRMTVGAIAPAISLYFDGAWVPREYRSTDYLLGLDERVFIFETFRRWLTESFFRDTRQYEGVTWLNRHLFAHGMSTSWHQSGNFRRLIVALATLALVESWYDRSYSVSLLFPEMDRDAHLLWQQALLRAHVQLVSTRAEDQLYHQNGRLVPELPTDDGATLRKANLENDCMNDLVRPMRDAGWSVSVDEPEESGLYMTVRAVAGERVINVALLYSCATANAIYRSLVEQGADVILYRGAPYRQQEFASGIYVPVGPVTGWKPPVAEGV